MSTLVSLLVGLVVGLRPKAKETRIWVLVCGTVGRAVASDTRGPQFESSHRQLLLSMCLGTIFRKDVNKGKDAGNCQFFLKRH